MRKTRAVEVSTQATAPPSTAASVKAGFSAVTFDLAALEPALGS